jgi:hypothetical protein
MPAIEIIRQNLSISQLRAAAARTADAKQTRRILAIAMVLDGHSRRLAAQASGRDRQTLRDWVVRKLASTSAHERTSDRSPRVSRLMPGLFRTLQPVSPVSLARGLIMCHIEKSAFSQNSPQ